MGGINLYSLCCHKQPAVLIKYIQVRTGLANKTGLLYKLLGAYFRFFYFIYLKKMTKSG